MVAALVLPALGAVSRAVALLFLGTFCLAAAVLVAVAVRDPARPPRPAGAAGGSPYRDRESGRMLCRIHAASALLVVPQFAVSTFALVFLVDEHGLAAITAGRLLAVAQACGAASRLGAGAWSDRVGSRLRPMRLLALAIALIIALLAAGAAARAPWAIGALLAAVVLAVSTNGLSFTAVAEQAGSSWAGRALGVQNTRPRSGSSRCSRWPPRPCYRCARNGTLRHWAGEAGRAAGVFRGSFPRASREVTPWR